MCFYGKVLANTTTTTTTKRKANRKRARDRERESGVCVRVINIQLADN